MWRAQRCGFSPFWTKGSRKHEAIVPKPGAACLLSVHLSFTIFMFSTDSRISPHPEKRP